MTILSRTWGRSAFVGLIALSVIVGMFLGVSWMGADWDVYFRPAALSSDPYSVYGNYAPPWTYWLLWPLAILPANMGHVVLGGLSLAVAWWYLRGDVKKLFLLVLSAPMVLMLLYGQIDGLFGLLGISGPRWLALALLACKPQGVALAGLRRLNHLSVALLLALLAISLLVYGFWPVHWFDPHPPRRNLSSLWTLPLGGVLLFISHKRGWREDWLLCLATVCITPYYLPHSLVPALAAFLKETKGWRWHVAAVVATWVWFVLIT